MTTQQAADAIMKKCKPCIHNQDAAKPCNIICEDVIGYFDVLDEHRREAAEATQEGGQRDE